MVNRSEMSFGLIRVIVESDKSEVTDVTNLAYNSLKLLLPDAKNLAKLERRAKREEVKSMAKNMLALRGKVGCDMCEDDSDDCDEDSESCPLHHDKKNEISKSYV